MNTSIYLKTDDSDKHHEEMYYLLTADGLFLNRRTEFFKSSVPVRRWPAELVPQKASLTSYFKIPQRLLELTVGFFQRVFTLYGNEAIVLLVWTNAGGYDVIVPDQECVDLNKSQFQQAPYTRYSMPIPQPGVRVVGSIHSHPSDAYMSFIDDKDNCAGIHVVVGRFDRQAEPPDFAATIVVDGFNFDYETPTNLFEGYERRRTKEVPDEWMTKVHVVPENTFFDPREQHYGKQQRRQ
jgi:hypothetical protein